MDSDRPGRPGVNRRNGSKAGLFRRPDESDGPAGEATPCGRDRAARNLHEKENGPS